MTTAAYDLGRLPTSVGKPWASEENHRMGDVSGHAVEPNPQPALL